MGSTKLKVIHVVIIAVVVCTILVVTTYVLKIQKTDKQILVVKKQYDDASAIAQQRPQAEQDLAAAKQNYAMLINQYERMLSDKMPPLTFENRLGGWLSLLHELGDVLGPKVASWPKRTGVKLTSQIQIPAGPNDANSVNTDVIVVPMGTLTVTGSFAQIMSHIRSWNRFDRLVQVDPVSLSGYSPNMTGQYNLTVYIFPKGSAGPPVAMAGGGAAEDSSAGSGVSGGAGPMGGFGMGGPGMGGPGMGGPGMGGPGMRGPGMGGPGMGGPGMGAPGMGGPGMKGPGMGGPGMGGPGMGGPGMKGPGMGGPGMGGPGMKGPGMGGPGMGGPGMKGPGMGGPGMGGPGMKGPGMGGPGMGGPGMGGPGMGGPGMKGAGRNIDRG